MGRPGAATNPPPPASLSTHFMVVSSQKLGGAGPRGHYPCRSRTLLLRGRQVPFMARTNEHATLSKSKIIR